MDIRKEAAEKGKKKFTILGFLAILIWGTSAAFTKTLSSSLGAYTAAAIVNLLGGTFIVSRQMAGNSRNHAFSEIPKKYWVACGSLFVLYTATSYVSMTMVDTQAEIMTMVLIRFLWPLFTLVLTIPMLKAKASYWLIVSVTVSFLGIVIAKMGMDWQQIIRSFSDSINGREAVAYLMGLVVSLSWAVYTNLTKKYMHGRDVTGVGIFMLLSGVILGIVALQVDEPRVFSWRVMGELFYQAFVASSVANLFWDLAIKKGNMLMVVLASNFLPIISTIMTAIMLGLQITPAVLVGAALVVFGTLWSKRCFEGKEKQVRRDRIHEV